MTQTEEKRYASAEYENNHYKKKKMSQSLYLAFGSGNMDNFQLRNSFFQVKYLHKCYIKRQIEKEGKEKIKVGNNH